MMAKHREFRQPAEGELWKRHNEFYTVEDGVFCKFPNGAVFDGFYGDEGKLITRTYLTPLHDITAEEVCDGISDWEFVQDDWRLKVADMAASYAEMLRNRIDHIQKKVEEL